MEVIIKKITAQFSKDDCVKIITPFSPSGSFWISGQIMVEFKGVKIPFETTIPVTYPLTQPHSDNISINFVNKDLVGYGHVNNDGSVCFHPDKDDDLDRKIEAELSGLKEWIDDYYIHDKEDERYTYLIPPIKGNNISTLYFGDNPKQVKIGEFGSFSYSAFSENKRFINEETYQIYGSYFKVGFDVEHEDEWSKDFLSSLKYNRRNLKNGLWCYIEEEPIKNLDRKRSLVDSWQEIQSYLPSKFLSKIYKILRQKDRSYLTDNELFVLLGYKIPTEESYEVHWNLLKIPLKNSPLRKKKVSKHTSFVTCVNKEIIWGRTVNCNYKRFFGRGRLSDKLTNSRILIIGVGALGSSLAETLVRGGTKEIFIDDFDTVETGNLCRANYTLNDLNLTKVDRLRTRLLSISPFVNVKIRELKINSIKKEQLEKDLNEMFDYVFDCSTDPEVSFIFDSIDFKGKVFSLGLTNNAKHLTCITGDNIAHETAVLYDCLENESASFFEGTGCGYPTFNANFNDINTVLNLSIKKINETLNFDNTVDSFYIKNLASTNSQIEIVEYVTFLQKDIEQRLLFPKHLSEKIEATLLQHYPKEFGGIFIGSKSPKFRAVLVENILLPDKYENGKAEFIRHPKSLNERLDSLFKESNGRIEYLGEFHSHPNASALPSRVDDKAMAKIAKASKVTTDNPILMIGEIDNTSLVEARFYIFNKKKLYEYEQ